MFRVRSLKKFPTSVQGSGIDGVMRALSTLTLVLFLTLRGAAQDAPLVVALKHIEAENAVRQAHELLEKEVSDITILADARSNQIYLLHENPKVTELLKQFFQAIDLPGEKVGMTFVGLNYITAEEALKSAEKVFGKELKGARAVLCERTNRILIGGTKEGRRQLEAFLVALDRQPRQIQVRTVITRVKKDAEGREIRTVLSQPTIVLQDGKHGVIMSGSDDESLELKVTATVIEPGQGPKLTD